jgi:YQGE family putative transporter
MRTLLLANMVYAFVLPIINVFVAAYVMQKSSDVTLVVTMQMAIYAAIPPTFLLSGWLMSRCRITSLYSIGMLANSAAMAMLMTLPRLDLPGIVLVGGGLGAATGLCWSSRGFLALSATSNENRNYFYGVETSFATVTGVLVPLLAGALISAVRIRGWLGGQPDRGYQVLTMAVFLLTLAASLIIRRGRFTNPLRSRFVFARFHKLWNQMQLLAALKGLAQAYIATAPAMLIMHVAREHEGSLGLAQAMGGTVSAVLLYTIGRRSRPEHRLRILGAGLALFVAGAALNALLFDAAGVWLFLLCLLTASPLLDLSYFPIQFRVTETVAAIEGRSRYAYIFAHEFGLLSGRLAGCALFLALAVGVGGDFALRYAVLIAGAIQVLSLGVAGTVCDGCDRAGLSPAGNELLELTLRDTTESNPPPASDVGI